MDDLAWLHQHFADFRQDVRIVVADHEKRDGEQFAALKKGQADMDAKLMNLVEARAEQVGAAKAIADLAERRASKNTRIVSIIAAAGTILTLCIQKHWLGF